MSIPYEGDSNDPNLPGIAGKNTSGGFGVRGDATDGVAAVHGNGGKNGVWGYTVSPTDSGVWGVNDSSGNGVAGLSKHGIGVRGDTTDGIAAVHGNGGKNGVWGYTLSPNDSGVWGVNDSSGNGVAGLSKDGFGVRGDSPNGFAAVHGHGGKNGVWGYTVSANDAGVFGSNDGSGNGVAGFSKDGAGVIGRSGKNAVVGITASDTDAGVNGRNDGKGFGVFGFSQGGHGVEGHSGDGIGVVGFSQRGLAGRFIGDVEVTGDIQLVNADCAEDFDIAHADRVEPGTVMALGEGGILEPSQFAYDKRVAGVISGAGDYKPGIVLDKQGSQPNRKPIALVGKVYCKVDAQFGSVETGDLLTSSPTPGHAMRAADHLKAFGAVIGKALRPLATGQGLIPILIALQ